MFRPSEPIAQSIFASMAKRRIAQIMRQTGNLHHGTNIAGRIALRQKTAVVQHHAHAVAQAPAHAGNFNAVRQTVVRQVMLRQRMHLRFTAKTAEGSGENNPVVVNVKIRTQSIGTFLRRRGNGRHDFAVFSTETLSR
ncbi:Uncharacterised protein [Mycobacteroides abscessus subsp. massiliense]|nr:Uncharacterised protein [Mycobacteroides abscessus subsp. massiliense]